MNYREQVVDDALRPLASQARRRHIIDYQKSSNKTQDSRLLSTLQRNQQQEQRRLTALKRMESEEAMALDAVHIPNQDDEYFVVGCNQGNEEVVVPPGILATPSSARRGSRSIPKPIRTKSQVTIKIDTPDDESGESGNFEEVD